MNVPTFINLDKEGIYKKNMRELVEQKDSIFGKTGAGGAGPQEFMDSAEDL